MKIKDDEKINQRKRIKQQQQQRLPEKEEEKDF